MMTKVTMMMDANIDDAYNVDDDDNYGEDDDDDDDFDAAYVDFWVPRDADDDDDFF
jgi:hypothetical protein